jgi:hypothetical protein
MPSTHTSNALSMPFFVLYMWWVRGEFVAAGDADVPSGSGIGGTWLVPWAVALAWFGLTGFSRLYMGVHSPADIVGGIVVGLGMLALEISPIGSFVDRFTVTSPPLLTGILTAALVMFLMFRLYPKPLRPLWVNSPGDTTLILGVWVGIAVGSGLRGAPPVLPREQARAEAIQGLLRGEKNAYGLPTTSAELKIVALRVIIGFACLLVVRAVFKALGTAVLTRVLPPRLVAEEDLRVIMGPKDTLPVPVRVSIPASTPAPEPRPILASTSTGSLPDAAASSASIEGSASGTDLASVHGKSGKGAQYAFSVSESKSTKVVGAAPVPPIRASEESDNVQLLYPMPAARRYEIELPTKLLTYAGIGWSTTYGIPLLFHRLGLGNYYGVPGYVPL